MARCRYNLRESFMPTAPSGGDWVYNGYSSTSPTGPFTDTPSTPLFAGVDVGDTINLGDNPDLPYENKDEGYYSFTYNYSGGSNTLVIELLDNTICTGPDQTITVSASASSLNLEDYLSSGNCSSADTSGEWINVDGASGWNTPIFNPAVAGEGTYTFDYKLHDISAELQDCSSCPDYDTRITVNVTSAFIVNIDSVETSCTKTMSIEHPDNNNDGEVKIEVQDDTSYPIFSFRTRVSSTCGSDVVSDVQTYEDAGTLKITNRNWNPAIVGLSDGGYIQYVRLTSPAIGTVDVPTAPSGLYQALFSGSGGVTNATKLTFNTVSPAVFMDNVLIAIKNHMFDVVGVSPSDLDLSWDISGSNQPAISCSVRHNAGPTYVGIDPLDAEIVYKPDPINSPFTTTYVNSTEVLVTDAVLISDQYVDDCITSPPLRIVTSPIDYTSFLDVASITYNNIAVLANSVSVTINESSPLTNTSGSCNAYTLTANPSNCLGTVSYSWTGGSTSSSITVAGGTYTVTANCSNPMSSDNDTVSV